MQFLFNLLGIVLPSTNKWWTFPEQVELQSFGFLMHAIMPRVLRRALVPQEVVMPADDVEINWQEAWKIHNNKKHNQAI